MCAHRSNGGACVCVCLGRGGSEHGSEKKNVAQLHLIHQSSHMEMT